MLRIVLFVMLAWALSDVIVSFIIGKKQITVCNL